MSLPVLRIFPEFGYRESEFLVNQITQVGHLENLIKRLEVVCDDVRDFHQMDALVDG